MSMQFRSLMRSALFHFRWVAVAVLPVTGAMASSLEVFHADSLAGPMRELKKAFEAKHADVTLNLTSGVSRELAARILKGDACDVFAPSSPAGLRTCRRASGRWSTSGTTWA